MRAYLSLLLLNVLFLISCTGCGDKESHETGSSIASPTINYPNYQTHSPNEPASGQPEQVIYCETFEDFNYLTKQLQFSSERTLHFCYLDIKDSKEKGKKEVILKTYIGGIPNHTMPYILSDETLSKIKSGSQAIKLEDDNTIILKKLSHFALVDIRASEGIYGTVVINNNTAYKDARFHFGIPVSSGVRFVFFHDEPGQQRKELSSYTVKSLLKRDHNYAMLALIDENGNTIDGERHLVDSIHEEVLYKVETPKGMVSLKFY